MTATAFELTDEMRALHEQFMQTYMDRPIIALFLIRGTEKSTQLFQTMNGFRATESKFVDDCDMLNMLNHGGSIVLATFTTVEEACEQINEHMKSKSRFPFIAVRDLDVNDTTPLLKYLRENQFDLPLMFDRPECYAEEYRHLLPEL